MNLETKRFSEGVAHTDMLPIDKGQWLILASCDYVAGLFQRLRHTP